MSGFFRNGKCDTNAQDAGMHTVCVEITDEFLAFSSEVGNDLSTPHPEMHFPGLQAGDCWCLCLGRWAEAYEAGKAPRIKMESTHASVLEYYSLNILREFAIPPPHPPA